MQKYENVQTVYDSFLVWSQIKHLYWSVGVCVLLLCAFLDKELELSLPEMCVLWWKLTRFIYFNLVFMLRCKSLGVVCVYIDDKNGVNFVLLVLCILWGYKFPSTYPFLNAVSELNDTNRKVGRRRYLRLVSRSLPFLIIHVSTYVFQ